MDGGWALLMSACSMACQQVSDAKVSFRRPRLREARGFPRAHMPVPGVVFSQYTRPKQAGPRGAPCSLK